MTLQRTWAVSGTLLAIAVAGTSAPSASARTVAVTCRGGSSSCTAIVGVAGGASNEKVRVALTDTNLKLVAVTPKPSFIRGAYLLTRGSYSLGGSLYTVTLNAVRAIPRGATLTLRFSSKGRAIKT